VLALPTLQQMLEALPAGTRAAAVAMLRAGDPASGPALRSAIQAVRNAGLDGYDESALAADLAGDCASCDLAAAVTRLALQFSVPAHDWFLAGIVRIGLAEGQLSPRQRVVAREIAGYLGMTLAQADGVICSTEESAAPG
jgi:hypothetical protein